MATHNYLQGTWRNRRTGTIYRHVYITNGIATCTVPSGSQYLTQAHNIERVDTVEDKEKLTTEQLLLDNMLIDYKRGNITKAQARAYVNQHAINVADEREIALARKVLGVTNYFIKRRGVTLKKRLDILSTEMQKIIPDTFGAIEEENNVK
jgi:hypothetical protein